MSKLHANKPAPTEVPAPQARPFAAPSANGGASVDQVMQSFHSVRAALADLLNASGADPNKTRESARHLGLNRGLVWRVSRIIRSEDLPTAAGDVPGKASMDKFIEACRGRGASEGAARTAQDAIDRFEDAVGRCFGDRKTLAMLMASNDGVTAGAEQERARRKLFEGACSVWGVQAQVRFVTVFVFPSRSNPDWIDVGHTTGYVGFRRLRSIPWPLSYEGVHQKHGELITFEKEPLDPEAAKPGRLQIISRFCDPPDPVIDVVPGRNMRRFELAAGPVGNQGLTTCVFGTYLHRLFPRTVNDEHENVGFYVLLETPVERVMFDMFVHRDLHAKWPPETYLLDRMTHPHEPREHGFEREVLPLTEKPFTLGPGASGAVTPHISWYPRLLEFIGERIGHSPDEFIGSRFQMAHPPIPTSLHRRFPLPPRS